MGYSEVLCHICGVSFNIGRVRTPHEPREAAWQCEVPPSKYPGYYVDCSYSPCPPDSGCMFTMRKAKDENRGYVVDAKGRRKLGERCENQEGGDVDPLGFLEADDDADGDWVAEADADDDFDDEPLEYESDDGLPESGHGSEEDGGDVIMEDVGESHEIHDLERGSEERESFRQFWIQGLQKQHPERDGRTRDQTWLIDFPAWLKGPPPHATQFLHRPVQDEMFPLHPGGDDVSENGSDSSFECDFPKSSPEWYDAYSDYRRRQYKKAEPARQRQRDMEHIAGPKCEQEHGYSGHEISVEGMRGCQTAQCLVRKPNNGPKFESLPDDEDFEKDGDFFLSGLTDHMPSRDCDYPKMTPARHGCEEPHAENCLWDKNEAYDYALPFHPPCFEIYKRASLLAYGRVDVNALTSWWSLEAEYDSFRHFPRDPMVHECSAQWWNHKPGTAYLVANPLFIPSLSDILEAAIDRSPEFKPQQRAFGSLGPGNDARDPFALLPAELQFQVLDHLLSEDIASLRLSSRVFSELPVSFFRKLVVREMPWLWEAWPTTINRKPAKPMPYSTWATVEAQEATLRRDRQELELAKLVDYVDIVKDEMPELGAQVDENFARCYTETVEAHEQEWAREKEERTPICLPPDKTNYFTLYTLIMRYWFELPGLRNRKRIWADCQEIIRRVDAYKEEGIINKRGILGDLREVVKEQWARKIAARAQR